MSIATKRAAIKIKLSKIRWPTANFLQFFLWKLTKSCNSLHSLTKKHHVDCEYLQCAALNSVKVEFQNCPNKLSNDRIQIIVPVFYIALKERLFQGTSYSETTTAAGPGENVGTVGICPNQFFGRNSNSFVKHFLENTLQTSNKKFVLSGWLCTFRDCFGA